MKTRYKLLLTIAGIVIVPIVLFTYLPVDIAFYASIFINLFIACWFIEILANEISKRMNKKKLLIHHTVIPSMWMPKPTTNNEDINLVYELHRAFWRYIIKLELKKYKNHEEI